MKIFVKLFPIIAFILMLNEAQSQNNLTASDSDPRIAMPILTIAPDARTSGMGNTGAATSPSINDLAWNCAKYVFNEYDMGVSLSYVPWMRNVGTTNINLMYLTGFYKLDAQQSLAASIRYFSLGSLDFMTDNAEKIRNARPYELAVDIAYALRLGEYFSTGVAFRYLRSDLSGGNYSSPTTLPMEPANGVAADIGFYYMQPVNWGNVSAGLSIINIGTKVAYTKDEVSDRSNFLPTTLRLAGGLEMDLGYRQFLAVSFELSKYLVPTPPEYLRNERGEVVYDSNGNPIITAGMDDNVSVPMGMIQSFYDSPNGFSGELRKIKIGGGAEYNYADIFKIRAGFYYDPKNTQHRYATLGLGIIYNAFTLDLSYLIPVMSGFSSPLANTVHITLGVNIGEPIRY